jgi:lipid A 3-O-deacylase
VKSRLSRALAWGLAAPRRFPSLATGAALLCLAPPAAALDGVALEYGQADSLGVELVRAALQWDWKVQWLPNGNWHLGGYWDVSAGYWFNNQPVPTNSGLWDFGVTPIFRIEQTVRSPVSPYIEFGVGAHLLSSTSVSPDKRFSTAFQFGSLVGFGARFGPNHAYELGYRYQHLSNADIKAPNDGIEFHEIRLGYWF